MIKTVDPVFFIDGFHQGLSGEERTENRGGRSANDANLVVRKVRMTCIFKTEQYGFF